MSNNNEGEAKPLTPKIIEAQFVSAVQDSTITLDRTKVYIERMIKGLTAKQVMDLIKSQEQILLLQMNEITMGLMEHIQNNTDPIIRQFASKLAQEMIARKIEMVDSHAHLTKLLTCSDERAVLPAEQGGDIPGRVEVSPDEWMKTFSTVPEAPKEAK